MALISLHCSFSWHRISWVPLSTLRMTVCAKHAETVKHPGSLSSHRGEVWWVSKSSTALWSVMARIYQVCYFSAAGASLRRVFFLVTIILIVRWRAVSSWKEIAKTTRAEKKKKNHWKCTADRCGCSSRGKCGNVVLRDFLFFYVSRWIRFRRFYSVCCCFPLLMWWIELTMKWRHYCHKNCSMFFLRKRISKTSSFLLRCVQIGTAGAEIYRNCAYSRYF